MSTEHPTDDDLAYVLRLAFGHRVTAVPIPIASGLSDPGMAFALQGRRVPPRVLLRRYLPRNQIWAYRSFAALQALRERDFPVPDVYYVGWSYHTRCVLLLIELIEGRTEAGNPHAFFARVGSDFAYTLARLHQLEWPKRPDLPVTPLRYALEELGGLVHRLDNWQLVEIFGWLWERLDHVQEQPYVLIHGDYTLQNVIAEGVAVKAVQGWDQAVVADPRFDVGYASAVLGSHGTTLSNQFLEAYSTAAGPVNDSAFWEVLGALRLLVRVGRTLSTLRAPQRERFLEQAGPAWNGLLSFVAERSRKQLL
jgi:aminoglycoside phosphotransferase (APT) family kinase protein